MHQTKRRFQVCEVHEKGEKGHRRWRLHEGKHEKFVVSEKDCGKLWKEHMEKIMNVENEWDQMVEADMVDGVTDEEVMEAINTMKLGKAVGPSEVNMDMIIASGKFGVGVIKKLCHRVLDGKGLPEEWKTSIVVPIFNGKEDVME